MQITISNETMIFITKSDQPSRPDMYRFLQLLNTPNIADLFLIASNKRTKHQNLTFTNEL